MNKLLKGRAGGRSVVANGFYWRRRASEMQKRSFAFPSQGVRKPVQVYRKLFNNGDGRR
ncbi:MAG: hypothetical protein UY70_C0027G0007 [Candidatus Kaiserbacteria bacterium GW2011_GWB1_52_6]|uniref:Uncharacterized protein n=2 Tax=Candidatus Kaiseribacteriota TaxID=1752734 RepID=A0A0G2AF08_9BACT|nr:MAG: hypothetical protein UY70_C0027G0007 [Candidatus Kaiserbacteria bacterium GW2011_GWB1_52_6]KKW31094.1 MAG: hypothetical protein UY74_C0023G0005 [Candidatus Kaiserbacteria bacterium GW2011_GWC2_52_8b]